MTEKGIAPYQQPVGAQDEEREGTESFWSEKDCGHLPMAPTHPAPKTPARPAPGPAVRAADTAPRAREPRPRSPPRTRVCPAASSRRLLLPAACVLFSARTGTRFPRDAPGGQGGRRRRFLRPPFTPTSEAHARQPPGPHSVGAPPCRRGACRGPCRPPDRGPRLGCRLRSAPGPQVPRAPGLGGVLSGSGSAVCQALSPHLWRRRWLFFFHPRTRELRLLVSECWAQLALLADAV